jgi:pimeloyl-ACP methyl ester carboxylesterase
MPDSMHFLPPRFPQPQAPLLVYLPGMDGTGKLLRSQMPTLEQSFDIRRLSMPVNDLTDWDGLVKKLAALIRMELDETMPRRLLYLCGESFGGCLALKLASVEPELCDRLILINPASSFQQQAWMRLGANFTHLLPTGLYQLSCLALLPFLAALERISAINRTELLRAMQAVDCRTAMWRVALLNQFDITMPQLRQVQQPTLVISSGQDRLLPSAMEGRLLTREIPRSHLHNIPHGGHAVLLEQDVNLHDILHLRGFLEGKEEKNLIGLALEDHRS